MMVCKIQYSTARARDRGDVGVHPVTVGIKIRETA